MSMQTTIDQQTTAEVHFNTSFLFEDEVGPVNLPDNCTARFYNCTLTSVEIGRDCAVHIRGGTCQSITMWHGTQFLIEDCPLDQVIIYGSRGTIKKTDASQKITNIFEIYDKSKVELIDVTFEYTGRFLFIENSQVKFLRCEALVPKIGIHGIASTIVISSCNFIQTTQYTVKAEKKSSVQITDSHIEGLTDCPALIVAEHSTGIVTQGDGPGPANKGLFSGISVIECSVNSYVKVKDSEIVGSDWSDYGILCKEDSMVECSGDGVVKIEGGALPGIGCYDGSSVTIANYHHVTSVKERGLDVQRNSKVRIFSLTEKIESLEKDAIYIRDHSRVEVYDVPLIFAPVGDAVDMSEWCDFIGVNITDKMEGVQDYGILATVYCNAKIDNVKNCIGDGEDGVFLENYSRLIAINGQVIMGKGDNGIEASDNCQIVVQNYTDEIVGLGTDGIHMEDNCHATIKKAAKVRGVGRHGIYMLDNCTCHTRECDQIIGEGEDGIHMQDNCRNTSMRDGEIKGLGKNGVYGNNLCETTVEHADLVQGLGEDGIQMIDGRLINVRNVTQVEGVGRDGIHATKTSIDVYKIDKLYGTINCVYTDQCVGTFETIPDGDGKVYGLYAENGCDLRFFRCEIKGGPPKSLYMLNSCRLFSKDVKWARKDALTQEDCEVYFENVEVGGVFESLDNCKHEWLRTVIYDKIIFEDSIYRWKEVEIKGTHECERCIGKAESVEVQGGLFKDADSENHFSDYELTGDIDHDNCTTKLKGSYILGSVLLSDCTFIGENTEVVSITDFTGSRVEYDTCKVASINGKNGSSYNQRATTSADITLNKSGGGMEGGKTGPVSLTDSSFEVNKGEISSLTINDGSCIAKECTCSGAVIVTNGAGEMQSSTCTTISLTNSSFEIKETIAAAVTLASSTLAKRASTVTTVTATSSTIRTDEGLTGTVSLTQSKLFQSGGTCGDATGTDSSVDSSSGFIGLVNITRGSVAIKGSNAGNITMNDGGITLEGGEVGPVILNSGGVRMDGTQIVGAVTINNGGFRMDGGRITGSLSLVNSGFKMNGGTITSSVTVNPGGITQQGGNIAGTVTVTNGGFKLSGGTVGGSVTLISSGMAQQGGTVASVSMAGSGYTAKGGTCSGGVSGSGALELIDTVSGPIAVGHVVLPNCQVGMVVRVGNDKLYEVFDENVKRWFNKNLHERVTLDKEFDVYGNYQIRVDKDFELDVHDTMSFISASDADINVGGEFDINVAGEIDIDSENSFIDLAAGAEITLNSAGMMSFLSAEGIVMSAQTQNITMDAQVSIFIRALASITTGAPSITEITPSWLNQSGTLPPIIMPPMPPETPEIPDPMEQPIP